jgi:hypothetical protein
MAERPTKTNVVRGSENIKEERRAAENAKAILGWLTPSTARTDQIIFVLRSAANLAATTALIRLERMKALNVLRDEAAISLNAVCSLMDKRLLTEEAIKQANSTVEAWLSALPARRQFMGPF